MLLKLNLQYVKFFSWTIISLISYSYLAAITSRENSISLFIPIILLFGLYFYAIYKNSFLVTNYKYLIYLGFVFRFLFLFTTPFLSDDYFRFIWDGRLIEAGINPFSYLPDYITKNNLLPNPANLELFDNMNSKNYFSLYPPILQGIFFTSAKLSFNNNLLAILVLRVFVLLAEFGTFIYLKKILSFLKQEPHKIFLYLLNPLVIVELSGNLHFEAVMLFFVTASFYFFLQNKNNKSALFLGFAVATKMIPLIILPIIIKKIGLKKGLLYSIITMLTISALFIPFINLNLIHNIGDSLELYFQKFEFNGSIYYALRWIGFEIMGYNTIGTIGKVLPIISFSLILLITYRFKNENDKIDFFNKIITILFVYYFFSLIVHPWYISFLVLLSVFSKTNAAIIWSMLIFGTYISYTTFPYKENLWVVFIEYLLVAAAIIINQKKVKNSLNP